uniref:Uncharacterized protein n=1 Tax=Aegilops tauschii subsp. strangulata TaxID=200361 RepID=A0A452XCQ9_AEGTS
RGQRRARRPGVRHRRRRVHRLLARQEAAPGRVHRPRHPAEHRGRGESGAAAAARPRRRAAGAAGAVRGRPLRRRQLRAGHRRLPVRLPRRQPLRARGRRLQEFRLFRVHQSMLIGSFGFHFGWQYKTSAEAATDGVRIILRLCAESMTVKRVIHTASVTAASPLTKSSSAAAAVYSDFISESCWTLLDVDYPLRSVHFDKYIESKVLSEKELLSYNDATCPLRSVPLCRCLPDNP